MPEVIQFQVSNQLSTADTPLSLPVTGTMLPRRTGQTGQ